MLKALIALQRPPLCYDAAAWEIFTPLVNGGRLILAGPEGDSDTAYMVRAMAEGRITNLQLVPTLARLFVEEPELARAGSLKRLLSGRVALLPRSPGDRGIRRRCRG